MKTARPLEPYFETSRRNVALYLGDARALLESWPSESFDLIFADPPGFLSSDGINCQSGRMASVNKGKASNLKQMHEFNLRWLRECHRVLKPNGTIFVSGTSHNIYSVGSAMQTLGYKFLNNITWYKTNPSPNLSRRHFMQVTETILWAKRDDKARHHFNYAEMKAIGDPKPGKQMQSLWQTLPPSTKEKRYGKHPTQKPEALFDRIIRAASKPGDLVLDPFCGSGTTGVAAVRSERRFVGFDSEAKYINAAKRRITSVRRGPRKSVA